MKVQRTERHIIVKNKSFDEITFLSKNLYNYCNYILRHVYFNKFDEIPEYKHLIKSFKIKDKEFFNIDQYDLISELTKNNQVDYRKLPSQVAQQIILLLYKNWKVFYKSLKVLSKLNGKPKMPNYKDKGGRNVVIFTNQQCRLKSDGMIYFPKSTNIQPLSTKVKSFNQVRIVPQATCYVVEVVYEKEIEVCKDLNDLLYLGIDLGVDNLATCVDNIGNKPFIINGKIIKSINQFFNKQKSVLQSYIGNKGTSNRINSLTHKRNNKVQDYLHKTSRYIINYCINNKIKTIVIGHNNDWKNEVNMSKRNNQNFVYIPFATLIQQIQYKAEEVGISVIEMNESYTSKCDSLALEEIKKHEFYIGKRIKRGLFQSSIGKLINADVNGDLNILRKVIQDGFVKDLLDKGNVFLPNRINPIKVT